MLEIRLTGANTDELKIVLLKAIANAAAIKSLPLIEKMLTQKESLAVRVHCIYAMQKMVYKNKMQVCNFLQTVRINLSIPAGERLLCVLIIDGHSFRSCKF